MLVRFFYQRFLLFFLLAASICFIFFTSCNVFLRLQFIPFASAIPFICWYMLPLVGVYAFPFASSFAVAHVLGQLITYSEDSMLYFCLAARSSLHKAVLMFSLTLAMLYAPLVLEYGPQSYSKGKLFLLSMAKEHLTKLEPGKIHTPFPKFMLFFQGKDTARDEKSKVHLNKLFIGLVNKQNNRQFFIAKDGELHDNTFQLYNGSIILEQNGKQHVATFEYSKLELKQFLHAAEKDDGKLGVVKFSSFFSLIKQSHNNSALFELHKRITTILWQVLFPLLAFLVMMLWGQAYGNALRAIILSAALYFIYFANVSIAHMSIQWPYASCTILYLPVLILFFFLCMLYYRRFY